MRRLLLLTVVLLVITVMPASAGGGCHYAGFSDESANVIRLEGNCFRPTVARIEPGETVTWVNQDPVQHSVGGVAGSFGDPHKPLGNGDSIGWRFDDPGVFPYFCVFHPGMAGAVVVGDGQSAGGSGAVKEVEAEAASASEPAASSETSGSPAVPLAAGGAGLVLGLAAALGLRRLRTRERAQG